MRVVTWDQGKGDGNLKVNARVVVWDKGKGDGGNFG